MKSHPTSLLVASLLQPGSICRRWAFAQAVGDGLKGVEVHAISGSLAMYVITYLPVNLSGGGREPGSFSSVTHMGLNDLTCVRCVARRAEILERQDHPSSAILERWITGGDPLYGPPAVMGKAPHRIPHKAAGAENSRPARRLPIGVSHDQTI